LKVFAGVRQGRAVNVEGLEVLPALLKVEVEPGFNMPPEVVREPLKRVFLLEGAGK
jgi:hypothetical protein